MQGMKRRVLLAWCAAGGTAALLPAGRGALAQPRYAVSTAVLQQAVAQRFPMRFGVGGLLQLTVGTPVLRLLPQANRIATDLVVVAAGPALAAPSSGAFDLDFALRYERSDQTIRAQRLRVRSLRVAGLPPPYPELLDAFGQALAQQSFGEIVLHRLRAADLALAEALGLEPDTITVTEAGLVIGFAPALR
jgi:hypothetical protein